MRNFLWVGLLLSNVAVSPAHAENGSLFRPSGPSGPPAAEAPRQPGSLFAGIERNSVLAPPPVPVAAPAAPSAPALAGASRTARLLSLIAAAEAGAAGYDAVQHGARIRPPAAPTQMTLGQIDAWIRATPGQPHAIGRYQFIPATLRRVAAVKGYGADTPFSPEVQDQLAMVLLNQAGYVDFVTGGLPRNDFMYNLARIWAGLPLPNGQSYYQGYAGNAATMTWAAFSGGMNSIFPVADG